MNVSNSTLSRKEKNRITAAKNRAKAKADELLLDQKIVNENEKSKKLEDLIEKMKTHISKCEDVLKK